MILCIKKKMKAGIKFYCIFPFRSVAPLRGRHSESHEIDYFTFSLPFLT